MIKDTASEFKVSAPFKSSIIIVLLSIIIISSAAAVYIHKLKTTLDADTKEYITEIAKQKAATIDQEFKIEGQTLSALAAALEKYIDITDTPAVRAFLGQEHKNNDFKEVGILFPNNEARFSDGTVAKNFMPKEVIVKILTDGKPVISDSFKDPKDNKDIIAQAFPIRKASRTRAILFATQNTDYYGELLLNYELGGKGASYITKENGEPIIKSLSPGRHPTFINPYQMTEEITFDKNSPSLEQIKQNLAERKSGLIGYTLAGTTHRYTNYVPLTINDWYILSVMPTEVLSARANRILRFSLILCASLIVVFTSFLLYIIWLRETNRESMFKIAFTDPLSETRNLNKFTLDLPKIIDNNPGAKYALIVMDINKFKVINDIYGYKQGNMVLVHITNILKEALNHNEIFARIHADLFIFVMEYTTENSIIKRLKDLSEQIQTCPAATGKNYEINVSYGIFKISQDLPFFLMLDRANIARSTAKKNNENRNYEFYHKSIFKKILSEKNIENHMNTALKECQFVTYLQPKYDFKNSKITCAEALVRWRHPKRGFLAPESFIPIFEKNGFITRMDMYILEETITKIKYWIDKGLTPLPVSINLSRVHLNNPNYISELKKLRDRHNLDPKWIELELTESAVFENVDKIKTFIDNIHNLGFSIAMDDFGSGYSSLNVLKNLSFDTLKLDKEFLRGIETNPRAQKIIEGTVKMLKELQTVIVAEGVETKEQADFLFNIGCDMAQGYFVSKPLPLEEFETLLKNIKNDQ